VDIVTVILAAHEKNLWPYYALMATLGSVFGSFLTYRLAHRHGGHHLAHHLPFGTTEKYNALFKRWGFGAIAVPAMLPPPMPMVPFVLAAGALKYSWKRFLTAYTLGRAVRYSALGYLGSRYGKHIVRILTQYGLRILYVAAVLGCIAGIVMLIRRNVAKSQTHAADGFEAQKREPSGLEGFQPIKRKRLVLP
jgi:membrane protein YqaA with SNARE-associated domain